MALREMAKRWLFGPDQPEPEPARTLPPADVVPAVKAEADGALAAFLRGQQTTGQDDIGSSVDKLVRLGFKANPYVYRAVDLLASAAARVVVLPYRYKGWGDTVELVEIEDPAHPLKRLLTEPNDDQDWSEFMYELVAYNLLAGMSYAYGARPGERQPVRFMYALRPDWVVPQKNDDPMYPIGEYWYHPGGDSSKKQVYQPANVLGPGTGDVMRVRRFNPTDFYTGHGPGLACSQSIDTNNHGRQWNSALLKNGAFPPGILITDQRLNLTEMDQLESVWQTKYGGYLRPGHVPILGMLKWQNVGLHPADMQFMDGQKHSALEIAVAFGVPPEFLGDTEHRTYASIAEARYYLYSATVIPMLLRILGRFNGWLAPQYGNDVVIGYDEDRIEALQYMRSQRWQQVTGADFLTVDEKREELGYGALADGVGDVVLVDSNKTPLDVVSNGGAGGEQQCERAFGYQG